MSRRLRHAFPTTFRTAPGLTPGVSLAQSALQSTINTLVPGAYYQTLANQQFREGNYGSGAIYQSVAIGDAALGTLTFGFSSRIGAAARAAESTAQRGLSELGGVFTSETNAAGGKVVTSAGMINQNDVAPLVNSGMYRGSVNIISGVHGEVSGALRFDLSLYQADVARFGNLPGVNV